MPSLISATNSLASVVMTAKIRFSAALRTPNSAISTSLRLLYDRVN
jgi:hypothetical protein